jgi:hypothetical protein
MVADMVTKPLTGSELKKLSELVFIVDGWNILVLVFIFINFSVVNLVIAVYVTYVLTFSV